MIRIAIFLVAFVLVMGTLILFPGIDLATSGLFYTPGSGFSHSVILEAIHGNLRFLVIATVIVSAALFFWPPIWPDQRRAAIFLLLAMALGPGLVVNTVFKDHWGRARPATVTEFGGDKHMSKAFVPSDQCKVNCSFPAGDPAVGFFYVAVAMLLPVGAARRWGWAGALAFGAGLGLMRIAQGGHFLSDVIASGFIVTAMSWTLYRLLIAWNGLGALWRVLRHPSPRTKRVGFIILLTAIAAVVSFLWLDLPLARAFRDNSPAFQKTAHFITDFGVSTAYLVVSALLAIGLKFVGRTTLAWRVAYVFLAVAVSGLIGDLLKPVIGRARPKLLFSNEVYGFTWFGPKADYWSMPSGHSITAAALAFALSLLFPRLKWVWIVCALLIGASRVAIDAHFLSDVVVGWFIGLVTAWALAVIIQNRTKALT